LQSDSSRFSRREDRSRQKMATEGHGHGGKKNHQHKEKDAMDMELTKIRDRMDELALQMQQDVKSRWVYEWPMKTKKNGQSRNWWPKDSGGC
jgi:hypothetical protein